MLDATVVSSLREKFKDIHPLVFHRSVERAENLGELFDVLDTFPENHPVVWDEQTRRWVHTKDPTLANRFDFKGVIKKKRRRRKR